MALSPYQPQFLPPFLRTWSRSRATPPPPVHSAGAAAAAVPVMGIDLGTTNTVTAVIPAGSTTPVVVPVDDAGAAIEVGAREAAGWAVDAAVAQGRNRVRDDDRGDPGPMRVARRRDGLPGDAERHRQVVEVAREADGQQPERHDSRRPDRAVAAAIGDAHGAHLPGNPE